MQAELKLVPPKVGRSSNYRIRGTYLGCYVDRSAKTGDRATAKKALAAVKIEIERGEFERPDEPRFADLAIRYMNAGGERRFMAPILARIGKLRPSDITQEVIADTATALYPDATSATRSRQVYTPISSVLRHAGIVIAIKRPKGAQGQPRKTWMRPDQVEAYLAAARGHHPRFAALVTTLVYTGVRLSEALRLQIEDVDLSAGVVEHNGVLYATGLADVGRTKNGEPQRVHLPPVVVQAIRLALAEPGNATWDRPKQPRSAGSVFCLTKSGALYKLFRDVEGLAGLDLPKGVAFHLARHTYGAYTRAAGGRLEDTGRWTSRGGAKPYDHYEVTEAQRVADKFPGASGGVAKLKEIG